MIVLRLIALKHSFLIPFIGLLCFASSAQAREQNLTASTGSTPVTNSSEAKQKSTSTLTKNILLQSFKQAQTDLKLKKIDKAIAGFADIIVQNRHSVSDAKIQFQAATVLAGLQRKNSHYTLKKHTLEVTSTAYSSHVNQTDSTPWIAAWGDRLKDGMKIIAVSNDLLKMGLRRGSRVRIHGIEGSFTVLDKMNRRWKKRIDIYTGGDLQAARAWGMQSHKISFLTGLDLKVNPAISKKHYYTRGKKKKLSPRQKALAALKIRCNRQRPSCKRWVFLKRKKILQRFAKASKS